MKQLLCLILVGAISLGAQAALDKALDADASVINHIKTKLKAAFPTQPIDQIQKSAMPGFYEVRSGANFAYITADAGYLLVGDILDLSRPAADRSLTEASRREMRMSALPLLAHQKPIIYKPSHVKGVLTIFTDPECFYCQKLHTEIPELLALGIEVHYLSFPRQGLHSAAYHKLAQVWCAQDPASALNQVMKGDPIETTVCEKSKALLEAQLDLGRRLGVAGTPCVLLSDGTLLMGYRTAKELAEQAIQHQVRK